MTEEQRPTTRRDDLEAWWALIARILAFFFGLGMLGYETTVGGGRPYVIIAAIGLCGPVISQSVAAMFSAIRGGGNG